VDALEQIVAQGLATRPQLTLLRFCRENEHLRSTCRTARLSFLKRHNKK
jgi:hypothetical protein